jgi:hypothetical protein
MQFQQGESGNPSGRPRGARNKRTVLAEHLLEGDTEAIVRTMIGRAKQGDMAAVRLCMDRISPRLRDRPLEFQLPPLEKPADAAVAMAAIVQGLAEGALTAAEAADLARMVQAFAFTLGSADFEERLARLEQLEKDRDERSRRKLR